MNSNYIIIIKCRKIIFFSLFIAGEFRIDSGQLTQPLPLLLRQLFLLAFYPVFYNDTMFHNVLL